MSHFQFKTIFIFFLLSFHQSFYQTEASIFHRFLVAIFNNLPNNDIPLTLHCQSDDDDLGYHNITVGQSFNFTFHEDIIWKTVFYCRFWWHPKEIEFDVFNNGQRCIKHGPIYSHDCIWGVFSDVFTINGVKKNYW